MTDLVLAIVQTTVVAALAVVAWLLTGLLLDEHPPTPSARERRKAARQADKTIRQIEQYIRDR